VIAWGGPVPGGRHGGARPDGAVYGRAMTSVHDLSEDELRDELQRTREAYAEYVQDVGEHPSHASRDLGDGARRHLDVREELDRRGTKYHDDLTVRDDAHAAAAAGADPDAGGQAGGGHADAAEQEAARRASFAGTADSADETAAAAEPAAGGGRADEVEGQEGQEDQEGQERQEGQAEGPAGHPASDEDLPEKLDPGEIEPYA
jgi:hypothetical protein